MAYSSVGYDDGVVHNAQVSSGGQDGDIPEGEKGAPSGVASLASDGKHTASEYREATATTPGAMSAAQASQTADIKGDGDITTILLEAIGDLMASESGTGGTIRISPGESVCTAQLALPNTGGLAPVQKSITIQGAGAGHTGDQQLSQPWPPPNGGTILDLRYAAGPKIYTFGSGLLNLRDLSLRDTTDGVQDFIEAGFTTLHIDNVYFYGKNLPSEGTPQMPIRLWAGGFLGFNTVIERCSFNRVAGIYGKAFSNAVIIRDNQWTIGSGGDAAITLDASSPGAFINGCVVMGNLIECADFVTPIKCLGATTQNLFANSFYDPVNGVTTAFHYFDTNAVNNLILDCHSETGFATLTGGPSADKQTIISTNATNQFPKGLRVANAGASVYAEFANGGNKMEIGGMGGGHQYVRGFEGALRIYNTYTGGTLELGAGNRTDDLIIAANGVVIIPRGISATLPVYANNAAAVTGGLAVGRLYRTGGDPDAVCVVH